MLKWFYKPSDQKFDVKKENKIILKKKSDGSCNYYRKPFMMSGYLACSNGSGGATP